MKRGIHCIAILVVAGVLSACAAGEGARGTAEVPRVGMANPASVHCVDKGGKVEIRKNSEGGEYGICHLPDGTQVEEWELFRRDNPAGKD